MSDSISRVRIGWLFLAVFSAVGGWFYVQRVLIPHQVRYAEANRAPRGNLSDLYKLWLGAQELLLHGRDPYSVEVTRKIQAGYYGRPLAPSEPGDQDYQQAFSYPVYVIFYLAPTVHLPFEIVRKAFSWILLGLTLASIPLWLHVLRWSVPLSVQASIALFIIGSLPVMQGLKLHQITLLVVPLLAMAMALLASERPILAGILLALATVKPQLVCLLLFWLMIWTLADWRRRYRWAASFMISMAILWAASEFYLPQWIPRFWQAVREYQSTGAMSGMDLLLGASVGTLLSRTLEFLALAIIAAVCWRERRRAANSEAFAFTLSLVLAATVLLVPTYGPYNQVLLIPALLIMLRERRAIWQGSVVNRALSVITIVLIGWPWISCIALAGLSFVLPPETVERGWAIPFWTTLQIPVGVTALMLIHYYQAYYQRALTAPAKSRSS